MKLFLPLSLVLTAILASLFLSDTANAVVKEVEATASGRTAEACKTDADCNGAPCSPAAGVCLAADAGRDSDGVAARATTSGAGAEAMVGAAMAAVAMGAALW
jgi:hypothetical protein